MKSHIFCSPTPVPERQDRVAMCGEVVHSAVWRYTFNSDVNPEFLQALSAINTCWKCFKIPLPDGYIYGMVSAEDLDETRRGWRGEEIEAA